ncbi:MULTISPECIES: DUF4870 domain-containing protein [Pseudoalteromonas]|uniref:DUF4870 domain-containing protein n=1 Tax=Pseudoalteromonas maricaloris TaxID=184924 RepID=A0A8I2H2B4_9GAMM|nr:MULTISPECIES: DUF4870 domain-containing protein [Pseudoalteromonas]KID38081.1 hypothetical protein QT15_04760 [Pseudoalteromonas flavipulchra NCIMB 2033 = ATCC BAA-314]KJY94570.1 hypothetical protein TW73_18075 [Pseudoalteromonas piscicida]MBD0782749.1 DUF4870 domain-containing protein [Pseudoalteromonas flavipulchra]MBE0372335.1 hypothetical protein [Pseudoalteromonas flavipulchra NCIMB 2033 = ATCC BAA-314]MCF2827619.1 DUF4870 domain-containing protein [Pseudoalteromonas sp. OF5H-5]
MNDNDEYWGMPLNTYCMLLHLSQLASFVAPGLGLVLPVVMWATNKDKSETIDQHGKATINWLISLIIYSIICGILVFVAVGILGFVVLAILNIIFAIIAAMKANNGEVWIYPLSFNFFK